MDIPTITGLGSPTMLKLPTMSWSNSPKSERLFRTATKGEHVIALCGERVIAESHSVVLAKAGAKVAALAGSRVVSLLGAEIQSQEGAVVIYLEQERMRHPPEEALPLLKFDARSYEGFELLPLISRLSDARAMCKILSITTSVEKFFPRYGHKPPAKRLSCFSQSFI